MVLKVHVVYSIKGNPRQKTLVGAGIRHNVQLCVILYSLYSLYLSSEASWAVAGLVLTGLGQAVSLAKPQVAIGPLHSK